ncbi:hypothetical protein Tco_1065559 [Tanacetum coccineum]
MRKVREEATRLEGPAASARLCRWFEKMESTFGISECAERRKVKFATATLHGRALTWWNSQVATLGLEVANGKSWTKTERFNELALLCPDDDSLRKERNPTLCYSSLPEIIKGETTSSRPTMLNDDVRMAHTLMEQKIQAKNERIAEDFLSFKS